VFFFFVHKMIAAHFLNKPLESVKKKDREIEKNVYYGIIYGIGNYELGKQISENASLAGKLKNQFLESFPTIRKWIEYTKNKSAQLLYTSTIFFERRRYCTTINSTDNSEKAAAERQAVNAIIQGSAADIVKLSMIAIYKQLLQEKLQSKIILQIHDELVLEVLLSEFDTVKSIITNCMEGAVQLTVPLPIVLKSGKTLGSLTTLT